MSKTALEVEVARFLDNASPAVLCVKGKWGVGKTFSWKKFVLERAAADPNFPVYAYVSLFGLDTLAALKFAIFTASTEASELTEPITSQSAKSLADKVKTAVRKRVEIAQNFAGAMGYDASAFIAHATFSSIKGQIICFDDLERRGADLDIRDVLGLASHLKEEKECKVVLLLNDEKLGPDREEFEENLEKVVDTSLVFAPSAEEAGEIAFSRQDFVQQQLANISVKLGITNIRVLKRMEAKARQVVEIVKDCVVAVREQAIVTVALASWSVMQPDLGPKLKLLKSFNYLGALLGEPDEDERKWRQTLRDVGYAKVDALDLVIIDGVEHGHFDRKRVAQEATQVELQVEAAAQGNKFEEAWDLYHDTLSVKDDEIARRIRDGAMHDLASVSPVNLNSTIILLKRFGYDAYKNEILDAYFAHHANNDLLVHRGNPSWQMSALDPEVREKRDAMWAAYEDPRDPAAVLASAEKGSWSQMDLRLLSKQSAVFFEEQLLAAKGQTLRSKIETLCHMAESANDFPDLKTNVRTALENIAGRSRMAAAKLKTHIEGLA